MGAKAKQFKISATEAKNKFGEALENALKKPVKIEKNGRAVAVLLSLEEFERLESIEDAWWITQAELSIKEGSLGVKESEKFLTEMLNAKD